MPKVQVWAELSDEHLRALTSEARRRGVEVQTLVEQCVNALIRDLEQEEDEGTDCPCIPS